jgi:hypothetical protein
MGLTPFGEGDDLRGFLGVMGILWVLGLALLRCGDSEKSESGKDEKTETTLPADWDGKADWDGSALKVVDE